MTSTDKAPERFDPSRDNNWKSQPMRVDMAGKYIRHSDHLAVMQAKDARIEELEGALRPFADEADAWEGYASEERLVEGFDGYSGQITVADCRHALAALQRKEGNE